MAPKTTISDPQCSIARSLAVIGEKWSMLIIREALDGRTTFSEFKDVLGVSADILTARLNTLVEAGVLERRPYRKEGGGPGSKERHAYHLTEAGRQLRVVLGALTEWGDANRPTGYGPASVLIDAESERPVRLAFLDPDGNPVDVHKVTAIRGPGFNAGREAPPAVAQIRPRRQHPAVQVGTESADGGQPVVSQRCDDPEPVQQPLPGCRSA